MMVTLDPSIFGRARLVDVVPFLWLGATGRHRVVVSDTHAAEYRAWLDRADGELRADWERMIDDGYRLCASHPSYHEIYVNSASRSDWSHPTPVLTLPDAIDFLSRPYRILVESASSDRAFLLCLCNEEQRRFLEERISREWAEIEHCGGISDLGKRVRELRKHPQMCLRVSALFDSDALRPGRPSATSKSVQSTCDPELHHHQLQRRAIENYLPKPALARWCKLKQGKQRSEREAIVNALFSLLDQQRAHYNMKHGFDRDAPRAHEAESLYNGVAPAAVKVLAGGLGEDVASLYAEGYVHHEDFEQDDTVLHAKRFVGKIIERIR